MKRNIPLLLTILCWSIAALSQTPQARIDLDPAMRPFYHGVESGDPESDRVIIWTRVTPDTGATGDITVYWQIASDTNFTNIVNYGKLTATEQNHYCVKADVCGLQPSTYYYYMFQSGGRNSIIGRTKTAPDTGSDVDSVRFAVVSCASWEHGYFNAYESISNRNDVDAVVHLGDYIYEYASGGYSSNISGRTYDPPTEAITELGYELRYSQYKLDKQLQRIHQLYPFIAVWDDHETANDAWSGGAENHSPATEGPYSDRKHNSTSTYFKWMPLRKPDPLDTLRIFRKLRYGKLLDLIMLDTRLYDRDEQNLAARNDQNRHLLGDVERAWFLQQLSDTSTQWKIIGNQVMFAPLEVLGTPVNADQWDGYSYERTLIQNHILNNNIKDVVILTGDIHTTWCNDVPGSNYNANTGAGSVCVEFVGSSVTSANFPLPVGANLIRTLNPHVKHLNLTDKGYYLLDVNRNRTQADYTYMSTVTSLGANDVAGPSFKVQHNERFLRSSTALTNVPQIPAPVPPVTANQNIEVYKIVDHYAVISENTSLTENIIPSLQVCPALSLQILSNPNHGTIDSADAQGVTYTPSYNFSGFDTISFAVCSNDSVPVCDTVYLFITIEAHINTDTIVVSLDADSIYSGCASFDDLSTLFDSISFTTPLHGTLSVTDSCFTYTPDSLFRGFDTIWVHTCDSIGICDTIIYIFRVDHPVVPGIVEIDLLQNSNVTYSPVFDDLVCRGHFTVIHTPVLGIYTVLGDSIKYVPYFNFAGDDTIAVYACDTCGFYSCDTLTIIYHILQPTALSENPPLAVLGVYPNPVENELFIQYYLFTKDELNLSVYDLAGKLIFTSYLSAGDEGLNHTLLNTSHWAKGQYVLELKSGNYSYRKPIVKE